MIPSIHLSLVVGSGQSTATLRLWRENENDFDPRPLALSGIQQLLHAAESDYYTISPGDHAATGQTLFNWLDGEDGFLRRAIDAIPSGAGAAVLAIHIESDAPSQPLAHLPWELLHDGAGFLVARPNPPILPVRWKRATASTAVEAQNRALSLLFMATSPEGSTELNFEEEEARILDATRGPQIGLLVEESGNLGELRELVISYDETTSTSFISLDTPPIKKRKASLTPNPSLAKSKKPTPPPSPTRSRASRRFSSCPVAEPGNRLSKAPSPPSPRTCFG